MVEQGGAGGTTPSSSGKPTDAHAPGVKTMQDLESYPREFVMKRLLAFVGIVIGCELHSTSIACNLIGILLQDCHTRALHSQFGLSEQWGKVMNEGRASVQVFVLLPHAQQSHIHRACHGG